MLIPPSLLMIAYEKIAEQSIGDLSLPVSCLACCWRSRSAS
jgi:TRAP-type C4-dicarboxylate transport system permease large subunit